MQNQPGGQGGSRRRVPRTSATSAQQNAFASRGRRAPGASPLGTYYYGHSTSSTPSPVRAQHGASRGQSNNSSRGRGGSGQSFPTNYGQRRRQGNASGAIGHHGSHGNVSSAPPSSAIPALPSPSQLEIQAQGQIDELVAASKAGTLGTKMLRSHAEFPKVANLKIHIADAAIDHSNPSESVLRRPSELLHVFHATREWLVNLSFRIASLGDTPERAQMIEVLNTRLSPRYVDTLLKVVLQARGDVKQPRRGLEAEYRHAGKLDVLEKAIELRRAETAQNGKPLSQSDVNIQETDMAITVETVRAQQVPVAPQVHIASEVPEVPIAPADTSGSVGSIVDVDDRGPPIFYTTSGSVGSVIDDDDRSPTTASSVASTINADDRGPPVFDTRATLGQGTPGVAELLFVVNGIRQAPLATSLPPGLDVTVQVTFSTDHTHHSYLDAYLNGFSDLVKSFCRCVNGHRAEGDNDSTHANASDRDSDDESL